MNILFLAPNINIKAKTGDAVHVRELVATLACLGHRVLLIVGHSSEKTDELLYLNKYENVKIYYSKPLLSLPRSKDLYSLSICLKISCVSSPEMVYERSYSPRIGVIMSKILRKPLILEINGILEDEARLLRSHIEYNPPLESIKKRIRCYLFNSASKVIAVTPGIKEELKNLYNISHNKILVIPNGANTDLFKPIDQSLAKKELGLNQKSRYVCFVGNFVPWQGVECLIKAAKKIREENKDVEFLIIGDGMMGGKWKSMVKKMGLNEIFTFTGQVPSEFVPKYINASDICVAPFVRERNEKIGLSPLKLYEYMACGKPVVGSNISGVGDLLEGSKTGVSFTPGNYVELSNNILYLLQNDELRKKMGLNGIKLVSRKYSWKVTAKKVLRVMETLK